MEAESEEEFTEVKVRKRRTAKETNQEIKMYQTTELQKKAPPSRQIF